MMHIYTRLKILIHKNKLLFGSESGIAIGKFAFLFFILMRHISPCYAIQLNGAYTINPAAPASTTNFRDFQSAIFYLTGSNSRPDAGPSNATPFGVSGPVEFFVSSGTYNISTMIEVPFVPGTSNINTVTFDGGNGNASSRIITGLLPGTAVFALSTCKYVGIRNLSITNTAGSNTVYSGVGIIGSTSSNAGTGCFVNNCIISLPNTNSTFLSYGITVNPNASGHGLGVTWADSLRIDSNIIVGGYFGFYMQGPNTQSNARNRDIKIRGNRFLNAHYNGIQITYVQNGIDFMFNTVSMDPLSSNNALYMYYCFNHFSGNASHRIIGNKFIGGYANLLGNISASNINPTKIHSNMVMNMRSGNNYGFNIYNGSGQTGAYEIYHNTININQASGGQGLYFYSPTGTSFIKNNIFAITHASSTAIPLHVATTLSGNVINYNIYYNKAGTVMLYRTGTYYFASNYKAANAGGDSSFNLLSSFIQNDSNLHLQDGCASTGVDLTYTATYDADGEPYSTTPHVGADQVIRLGNDISVIKFVTPLAPITTGSQDVEIIVKNIGNNSVYPFDAGYKLNNNAAVTQTVYTNMNACDTLAVLFTGVQQVSLIHSNYLRAFTSGPNWSADSNVLNDTIRTTLTAPLNGIYTIGGTGANYANFSLAADALHYGVSGPVTFLVAPGTYNEQVNISGPIPGSSHTNTITFDGINKANRIISYNASASPAVIKLSAKYITIRNFSIVATNSNSGIGVFIAQGAHACKVKSCNITVPVYPAMTCLGILIGGSEISYNTGYARVDSLEIDSNTIYNGYMGIVSDNSSNFGSIALLNKIRNNNIMHSHAAGIYLYSYQNGLRIEYNKVVPSSANQTNDGIYLYGLKNHTNEHPLVINGNRVYNYGYRGVVLNACINLANSKGHFTNNMIGGGQRYGYALGAIITNSKYWYIVNNSISNTHSTLGPDYGGMYLFSDSGLTVCNNLFAVNTSSPGLPLYMASASMADTMDYNIFYRADTSDHILVKIDSNYNSTNFRGAGGFNSNSRFDLPGFLNDTNLHIFDNCRKGMSFPFIQYDVDGQQRSALPTIGADEVPQLNNDLSVEMLLTPVYPMSAGLQNVVARVRNTGSNAVSSFTLSYKVNSGAAVNMSWMGTLNPCDTITLSFSGSNQLNLPATGIHILKVYSQNPNGTSDANKLNDTITRSIGLPLNGIYTVGIAPSDFTTIRNAVNALNDVGISGPVYFNIKAGVYNDSLRLLPVNGSSVSNPIVFRSLNNNRDSVRITSTGNITLRLEASNISFRNVTISQESMYGIAVLTAGFIAADTFYNCKISAPVTGVAGSATLKSDADMSDIAIRKCLFTGSYYGIWLVPVVNGTRIRNSVFDSNTVQNAFYSPLYLTNSTINFKIRNNEFKCNGNYNNVWFNFQRCDSAFEFSGNRITTGGIVDVVNMVFSNNAGNQTNRIKIFNNRFIAVGNAQVRTSFVYDNHYMDIYNNEMLLKFGTCSLGSVSSNIRFFHNTINSKSAALSMDQQNCTNVLIRNNILSNTGTGSAMTWASAPLSSGVQTDYNNLYSAGSNLVYWQWLASGPLYANLNVWRSVSGYEMNSVSYRPPFISDTSNLAPSISDSAGWAINGRGTPSGWIHKDINDSSRSMEIRTGPVDLGAYEFTPVSTAPNAIAIPATPAQAISANGGLQVFVFAYDTVAKINWSLASTPPSAIRYKRYSGVLPKHIGDTTALKYMYFYDDVSADSIGAFNYTIKIYYRTKWLGNTANESNLIIAKKQYNNSWINGLITTSTIDTSKNILSSPTLNSFSLFTGTENTAPMPVELLYLKGSKIDHDAVLNWLTASEINSKAFIVERSMDAENFEVAGTVKAAGNANKILSYDFIDKLAFRGNTTRLFYRLKMIDANALFSYSKLISIYSNDALSNGSIVYPNPFESQAILKADMTSATQVIIEIMDLQGKTLLSQNHLCQAGRNLIKLDNLESLQHGIYFILITGGEEMMVLKLVKE
ncbi:MAG: T9SS type A sorting domain-containing protein [Bacteroidota bacterium]|nr:T9SS type A sorting domain-containing protein [Bacteroidota bacterium]